jgi:excisionase family DNA binding protein
MLTPEEVAALLGFKVKTIYNWVYLRRIPHSKIGGKLRFDETVIREWMKKFIVPVGV